MSTKRHRDAATGAFTTAEDAAARPAETVAETVRRPDAVARIRAHLTTELITTERRAERAAVRSAERAWHLGAAEALRTALYIIDELCPDERAGAADAGGLRGRDYGDETEA